VSGLRGARLLRLVSCTATRSVRARRRLSPDDGGLGADRRIRGHSRYQDVRVSRQLCARLGDGTDLVCGAEDPKRPAGIWPFAWAVAHQRIPEEMEIGLAVNPAHLRSQDYLHIHSRAETHCVSSAWKTCGTLRRVMLRGLGSRVTA
jgi:hypothetical protein